MVKGGMTICRCIQRADQPIILTGYAALNKLLGREVYTSHMQLGGPKVIHSPISWKSYEGRCSHVPSFDLAFAYADCVG